MSGVVVDFTTEKHRRRARQLRHIIEAVAVLVASLGVVRWLGASSLKSTVEWAFVMVVLWMVRRPVWRVWKAHELGRAEWLEARRQAHLAKAVERDRRKAATANLAREAEADRARRERHWNMSHPGRTADNPYRIPESPPRRLHFHLPRLLSRLLEGWRDADEAIANGESGSAEGRSEERSDLTSGKSQSDGHGNHEPPGERVASVTDLGTAATARQQATEASPTATATPPPCQCRACRGLVARSTCAVKDACDCDPCKAWDRDRRKTKTTNEGLRAHVGE